MKCPYCKKEFGIDIKPWKREVDIGEILDATHYATGVTPAAILGRNRQQYVARARWMAIILSIRKYRDASIAEIGRSFNLDHTSVINVTRFWPERLANDSELRAEFKQAEAQL